jgi:tRNA pseudouridine38-40 synthase
VTEITQAELQQTQNWKLTLAYDGTDFHGWQVQPDRRTVQGELQAALERLVGEGPLPQGSGRTDAGVHALGQVASFSLKARIPAANLMRALNRTLSGSIRVLEARVVQGQFHARHSAVAKTYEYRVLPVEPASDQICPPFLARYVYAYSWRVNLELLQQAASAFVGEHDFRSFAASDPDLSMRTDEGAHDGVVRLSASTTVRAIFGSEWHEQTSDGFHQLVYRVRGNGFLHHMVRNLVGTMLDVGRGFMKVDEIPGILAAGNRGAAGPTAPGRGLFLRSVEYDGADRKSPNCNDV